MFVLRMSAVNGEGSRVRDEEEESKCREVACVSLMKQK